MDETIKKSKRKRMISTSYLIKQILKMLKIDNKIKVTKNVKTRKLYVQFWNQFVNEKEDDIKKIIS